MRLKHTLFGLCGGLALACAQASADDPGVVQSASTPGGIELMSGRSHWTAPPRMCCPTPTPAPCPVPSLGAPIPAMPGVPAVPGTTPPPPGTTTPPTTPTPLPEPTAAAPTPSDLTSLSALGRGTAAEMLGDTLGLTIPAIAFGQRNNPNFRGLAVQGAILVPSIRTMKIAESESPQPLDRFYFTFNYWDQVYESVNRQASDVFDMRVFRETLGVEKTFLDRKASIGLRLPLNTLTADSLIPGFGANDTAVGDLTVIFKYMYWQNPNTGSLLSGGVAITAPTGPDEFAGADNITSLHNTRVQPYLGYILRGDRWYVHGFTSVDVPTDSDDVTMLYNDFGVGYYLMQSQDPDKFLTALIPTLECHVNNPMNHRGVFREGDNAGTPDVVDVTGGVIFEIKQNARLRVGMAVPLTGPKPYDYEVLVQFSVLFGASRAQRAQGNATYY